MGEMIVINLDRRIRLIVASNLLNGVVVFLLSFVFAIFKYTPLDGRTVSALDIAMLVSVASMFIQSLVGIVVANFSFLGQGKDWRDFWSGGPFEVFGGNFSMIDDPWRIARGKLIVYTLFVVSEFAIIFTYAKVRGG